MKARNDSVFLFDCDNTPVDNDRVQEDLRMHLDREFSIEARNQYCKIFEELPAESGYVDYLGALQRYRPGTPSDTRLLQMPSFLVDYPVGERLYPGALDALVRCGQFGLM